MKNLIIILMLICLPCMAGELQNYFEAPIKSSFAHDTKGLTKKQLIKDDFQTYLNGGETLYGVLLFAKDEALSKKENKRLKYITMAISQYDCLLKYSEQQCKASSINISDEEYRTLDESFRQIIGASNALLF